MVNMKSGIVRLVLPLFTYFSPITTALLVICLGYYVLFKIRRRRVEYLIGKVPGPAPLPFIGNMLEIITGYDREWSIFNALN